MLKRLMIVIAFLLPLLPLLVLPLVGLSMAELVATEHLTPLTLAQLQSLPDGSDAVIEGRIDPQNATPLDNLAVYVREDRLAADLDNPPEEGRTLPPIVTPIVIALPNGQVRVVNNDYHLKNLMTTIKVPVQRDYSHVYSGLAIDERVTVVGTVQRDAQGVALRARVMAGGTWTDYRWSVAAPISWAVVLLGIIALFGLVLWSARKQVQRHAAI